MENKTDAIRREMLTMIVKNHGHKDKKTVIKKVKESGVYENFQDDNEVYSLVERFAKHHNLIFGYIEEKLEIPKEYLKEEIEEIIEKKEEINEFYQSLLKERDNLSKKLLSLNKLIETYEK